jgi:hypothetical protein
MLAYAAESGIDLKPDLAVTISTARDAQVRDTWTNDLTKQFWPAYSKLSAAIKPVNGDSLVACASDDLARLVRNLQRYAIGLCCVILPLSILMFTYTSISNEMNQRIADNDKLAITMRDKLVAISPRSGQDKVAQDSSSQPVEASGNAVEVEREVVVALQQFAANAHGLFRRSRQLNLFLFGFIPPDQGTTLVELNVPLKTFQNISDARDDQIKSYQQIRAYSKDVLDWNFIFSGGITLYFLPVLYAILGALAYALRSISQRLAARTYTPSYAEHARFPIAVAGGLVVGLFTDFTKGIPLSPLAIGFLVGYGVEIFFSFLDAILDTLKKVRS